MSDLADLGLTAYEADAYRTLLDRGRAPASAVVAASTVPEGRVYDVLNGLVARGIVRAHDGCDPTQYESVPPARAVDRLLAERERELAAERERYEAVADAVVDDLAATAPVEGHLYDVGVGDADATAGIGAQIDRADEYVYSVLGPPYDEAGADALRRETEAFLDAVEGATVTVRLLATPAVLEAAPLAGLREAVATVDGLAVRRTPAAAIAADVVDGETVFFHLPAPFAAGERVGTVSVRDDRVAEDLAAAIRAAWERATPLEATGDP